MQIPLKVATYLVGLAAMFVVAAGIGRMIGPFFTPGTQAHVATSRPTDEHTNQPTGGEDRAPPSHGSTSSTPSSPSSPTSPGRPVHEAAAPGGLQVAEDGYTLRLTSAAPAVRRPSLLTFQIIGPDGRPVTAFSARHGKPLHLVVIRRDLTYYRHVHPGLSPDGTWTAVLAFARAGTYRVFADFQPGARKAPLTLGADLTVPGNQVPRALPRESLVTGLYGYTIERAGTLKPGERSRLTFTISRNGRPVTDLSPFLEAYGHLVALRAGDLAYLHVHPAHGSADNRAGPTVTFDAEVPSAGTYRLFLDFRHQGTIRTAEFTVTAT